MTPKPSNTADSEMTPTAEAADKASSATKLTRTPKSPKATPSTAKSKVDNIAAKPLYQDKKSIFAKSTSTAANQPNSYNDGVGRAIADILDTDYRGVSLYSVAMTLLVIAILWTGLKTVQQIQQYHHVYSEMSQLKRDFRQLQIERQRMLIEQQTFSATPQVTNRAVAELNMYYPNLSDRMIIHADNVINHPASHDENSQSSSANLPIDPQSQH